MGFTADAEGHLRIEPYPDLEQPDSDDEEQSIALLYRGQRTFAIGHGCAADWSVVLGADEVIPRVHSVNADALPAYEVTSLTPDIYEEQADGSRTSVSVSMEELSRSSDEGRTQVEKVLSRSATQAHQNAERRLRISPIATARPPLATWAFAPKHSSGWRRVGNWFGRTHWQRAHSSSRTRRCSTSRSVRVANPRLIRGKDRVYRP